MEIREMVIKWSRLGRDSRGATMVEYIVIVAMVFLAGVTAWDKLGKAVSTKTDAAAKALE